MNAPKLLGFRALASRRCASPLMARAVHTGLPNFSGAAVAGGTPSVATYSSALSSSSSSAVASALQSPLIQNLTRVVSVAVDLTEMASTWLISTFKRRRMKMNKHKLKKRRKLLRKNTKVSRGT